MKGSVGSSKRRFLTWDGQEYEYLLNGASKPSLSLLNTERWVLIYYNTTQSVIWKTLFRTVYRFKSKASTAKKGIDDDDVKFPLNDNKEWNKLKGWIIQIAEHILSNTTERILLIRLGGGKSTFAEVLVYFELLVL